MIVTCNVHDNFMYEHIGNLRRVTATNSGQILTAGHSRQPTLYVPMLEQGNQKFCKMHEIKDKTRFFITTKFGSLILSLVQGFCPRRSVRDYHSSGSTRRYLNMCISLPLPLRSKRHLRNLDGLVN